MRQVVLDTETTGLEWRSGHRVLEIACVEVLNRRLSKRHFHVYINPEREVDAGAAEVHGMTWEDLKDKPRFAEVVGDFLDFVRGAELIIHNAPFDLGFLNYELSLLNLPPISEHCPSVIDTLKMARELHPGKRNNLDALCDRYAIDNAHRVLHGALLDAELLADVYLAMTRGQESLIMALDDAPASGPASELRFEVARRTPRILRATPEELAEHERVLKEVDKDSKGACLWLRASAGADGTAA